MILQVESKLHTYIQERLMDKLEYYHSVSTSEGGRKMYKRIQSFILIFFVYGCVGYRGACY